MLVEFTVGNYRSFKEPVTLSLVAAKIKSKDKRLDKDNLFETGTGLTLLKSAGVYGANASGKSNLIRALSFMSWFVVNSSREGTADQPIRVEPFRLNTNTPDQPSFFEVVFVLDSRQYRYGFEATTSSVLSEWLYWTPTSREAFLFLRDGDQFKTSKKFLSKGEQLKQLTRENALFLSVAAQFNVSAARRVQKWFSRLNIAPNLSSAGTLRHTLDLLNREEYKQEVKDFFIGQDLAITDVTVEESSMQLPAYLDSTSHEGTPIPFLAHRTSTTISTIHHMRDSSGRIEGTVDLNLLRDESDGTKKVFSLAGPVVSVLREGKILVADELDARLHPLLTSAIIKMFHSPETNPKNAQLIFTTHDTNLLSADLLRRDQVWFVEKDELEASHLISLVEYRPRGDASFEKNYLRGKYGGIPLIRDIEHLGRGSDA